MLIFIYHIVMPKELQYKNRDTLFKYIKKTFSYFIREGE